MQQFSTGTSQSFPFFSVTQRGYYALLTTKETVTQKTTFAGIRNTQKQTRGKKIAKALAKAKSRSQSPLTQILNLIIH